ncbi:MAG TPA: hypothetical protein DET40_08955 [Lentisphaeria bacterium]|nr:MAG: hypothetical protein A2X45_19630 [Lentisphaerae bacterium GWF2_50_93]HCE43664.1 hypothetical protein [Lentisphaeria bacterium]
MRLHITNGDCAADALKKAGIEDEILPWRDLLHEGPAPSGKTLRQMSKIRASFIMKLWPHIRNVDKGFRKRDRTLEGFRKFDETVLWFEHDLFDQLQLIQILDWLHGRKLGNSKLSIVITGEYIGQDIDLWKYYRSRKKVSSGQLKLAKSAWTAFCSPDPRGLLKTIHGKTSCLPYLSDSLTRHLQQFPSHENGLNRTERQILEAVVSRIHSPCGIFKECQKLEEPKFMGDATFWIYLENLINCKRPLLKTKNGRPFLDPAKFADADGFDKQKILLTKTGSKVLEDKADWIELNGIGKWLGGVHLSKDNVWRWEEESGIIQRLS